MKISVPALCVIVATAKGNKTPALRGDLAITSDGTTGTSTCPIFQARAGSIDGCVAGSPHYDPQGMVCGNDGQNDEAYCNYLEYSTDATACVIGRCGLTPAEIYEPRNWVELPNNVQELYGSMGYNAFYWDYDLRPSPAAYQAWTELTTIQRTNAETLGYTESSWDSSDNGQCNFVDYVGRWYWCAHFTEEGCRYEGGCAWEQWSEGSKD